ncbi:hypothetical protein G3N59_21860 [Paraburkholderia sp. Ac-20340]|uniref:hypothetical protein n=1 Tax=Paraburkholderia sp. Ac-20340 TaxID=2703888 RepID=UPI00197CDCC9|nr:hypothetical protein [Paraburkholderia sp. Ac-20340]MBN3856029.1 hypothetical protein [Paraburkholderia sp. Ac-20340]
MLRALSLEKAETASRTRQGMHRRDATGLGARPYRCEPGRRGRAPVAEAERHERASTGDALARNSSAKAQLRDIEPGDSTRAAMLFAILTTTSSGKVRGATWSEFDLEAGIWTVPGGP